MEVAVWWQVEHETRSLVVMILLAIALAKYARDGRW